MFALTSRGTVCYCDTLGRASRHAPRLALAANENGLVIAQSDAMSLNESIFLGRHGRQVAPNEDGSGSCNNRFPKTAFSHYARTQHRTVGAHQIVKMKSQKTRFNFYHRLQQQSPVLGINNALV